LDYKTQFSAGKGRFAQFAPGDPRIKIGNPIFVRNERRKAIMYALLLLFPLGPGMRSTAEKFGQQFSSVHKTAKGFKSETLLADDTIGEYGSLTLWESKEDIEAFRKATSSRLQEAIGGFVKGPPTIRLFEVYEPEM
jgi:heme-degrading monooxygenase HmoA